MGEYTVGDRVRVDIPDETDPDHRRYHGKHGTIISVRSDDADAVTGDERDAEKYRVDFDDGNYADFRFRDLRLPITE